MVRLRDGYILVYPLFPLTFSVLHTHRHQEALKRAVERDHLPVSEDGSFLLLDEGASVCCCCACDCRFSSEFASCSFLDCCLSLSGFFLCFEHFRGSVMEHRRFRNFTSWMRMKDFLFLSCAYSKPMLQCKSCSG